MQQSELRALIDREIPSLIELRRDLHMHPELAYEERRTSAVVQRELRAVGAHVKSGLGKGTGVVGYLPRTGGTPAGAGERTSVALRADMDALPITEATGKAYASCTPGVMHACGHDGHTTILIGAARVLSKVARQRPVTLIFQPAEENGGGAEVMCQQGCLAGEHGGGLGEPVARIYGLHGWPTVEIGKVASRFGPLLAATDEFDVTIRGRQCHGAYPHQGMDPIVASAHVITALQSIASRNVAPQDSIVVTVGVIQAGTASNIIPSECRIVGTIRTLRDSTRRLAKERFFAVVEGGARALGCEAHITWAEGYPVTENERETTERFFGAARRLFGEDRVEVVEHATMGGEDFSYYGRHVPACFFLLGQRPRHAASYPTLHQPDFDFNDDAIMMGVEMMCELALRG